MMRILFFASLARCMLSGLVVLGMLCAFALPAGASTDPIPEDRASAVLARLRDGAGSLSGVYLDFAQEKKIPESGGTVFAHGRVSVRPPDSVRWELLFPVKAGFVLHGNGSASWVDTGGAPVKRPLRENPVADTVARFVSACLVFDERILRQWCVLDVIKENPPTVRLVPKNGFLRAHVREMTLIFTPDGALLDEVRIVTAAGGDTRMTFSGAIWNEALLRDPEGLERALDDRPPLPERDIRGKGKLYFAMLGEGKRSLPLILYFWRDAVDGGEKDAGTLRCIAFTVVLLRIGALSVAPDGTVSTVGVLDGQTARVLEKLGEAMFHAGPGSGEARYAGSGWSLTMVPAGSRE